MDVIGAKCASVAPMQEKFEVVTGASLAGVLLYVRTDVDDRGFWFDARLGMHVAGVAQCRTGTMYVGVGSLQKTWGQTGFAHEAYHLKENCRFDQTAYQECMAQEGAVELACQQYAYHAWWPAEVWPVLREINTEPTPGVELATAT